MEKERRGEEIMGKERNEEERTATQVTSLLFIPRAVSSFDALSTSCTSSNDFTASIIRICLSCIATVVRSSGPITWNHIPLQCLIANVPVLHCFQNSSVGLRIHLWLFQALHNAFGADPFGHYTTFTVFQQIEAHK